MDMKRKRASSDDEDLEDFITITKTIEELEILNETFVSKQHNAYRRLDKTVKNLRLHGGKERSSKEIVELEKMLNISRDEKFALKLRIDELEKTMEEKETDFKDLQSFNQNMVVRECKYNYEIQEAREELIKSMKGLQGGVTIGIKRLGELDPAPFAAFVKKRKCSGSGPQKAGLDLGASVEAGRLCSLWKKHLRDPGWHPYRMVSVGEKYQEIIDDEDPKLKGLKAELGEDAYKAVTTSLLEMNEYNPSGRYPVSEIWNFLEGRKASLKEGYGFVFEKLKIVGKSSVVSSSSIAIAEANPSSFAPCPNTAATNPSSSAPRPNVAATNPSSSAPRPNTAATNPSASELRPNVATTNPSSSAPSPNIAATNPSSSAPSPNIAATNPSSSTTSFMDSCEIPAAEFHDFMADKSFGKFRSGQIWALYSSLDELPKHYVQITEVNLNPDFEVHIRVIQHLDSSFTPKSGHFQWADKNMPRSCGKFKAGDETEVYKNRKLFSHMLAAKPVLKNNYNVYPMRGEVWALYKNYKSTWRSSNLKNRKYVIVEVLRNDDDDCWIKVLVLEQVTGFKTVFKPTKNSGAVKEINELNFLTFSHQIPAFRLTDEKEGSLRGFWELDPCSIPVYLLSSN